MAGIIFFSLVDHVYEGEIVARSGKLKDGEPFWVEPEGLHWLENHDTFAFDAIRVEVKV